MYIMDIITKINTLSDDIIILIKEFIPYKTLVFVNNNYYKLYHSTIQINITLYENYVRDMVRKDNYFVFEKILQENFDRWMKNKKYRYKNMIFTDYICFINYFCIENDSDKCKLVLYEYLQKRHLCKNLHKKNIIKYIKWTN
jgi:hypothetical protein